MPCLLRHSTKSSISKFWNVWDRFHHLKPQLPSWQADPALWQPALIQSTLHHRVFGGKIDHMTPVTHQVLLCATSSFSLISRIISRDHILIPWKTPEGYDGHSKQLSWEWLQEVLRQLRKGWFLYSYRKEIHCSSE